MSYIVLARKYRPQSFGEVYAQEHITQILQNAITTGRISHAYLFSGPRGVGKTSMARIMAKSLNCTHGPTQNPCNVCDNCLEITRGTSPDVIEIDGASNTGVDDIRDLQRELLYSANKSHYKIYIIDEVHMLSKNAFNALLKTLEEPPENVIFIFATTEPHKVIPTIVSRCQRFDFKRIPIEAIVARLRELCEKETIRIEDEALFLIAKKADGGMRDALSLLDQVIAYGTELIDARLIRTVFGLFSEDIFDGMMAYVGNQDAESMITMLHKIIEEGNDLQEFINNYIEYLRLLFLVKLGLKPAEIPPNQWSARQTIAEHFDQNTILYMISLLMKLARDIKTFSNPIVITEITLIKLTRITEMLPVGDLVAMIQNGEMKALNAPPSPGTRHSAPQTPMAQYQKPLPVTTAKEVQDKIIEEVKQELPAITELTQEILEQHWVHLLSIFEKKNKFTASYYKESIIEKVADQKIYLRNTSELSVKKMVQDKGIFEEIISRHFNLKIGIIVTLERKEEEAVILNPTMQEVRKHNPDFADFIEILGGRLETDTSNRK